MPINIPKLLPARTILESENIFIMDVERANSQDIRPLNIIILNLMPEKEKTEVQLLRLLGNTPLQVNVTFLRTSSYISKNTSSFHLELFYQQFSEIKTKRYDGLIITGAPIEHLPFNEVEYWQELIEIMEWSKDNVTSTLHICWGAQAALYYHFGINKYELSQKSSGVYSHDVHEWTEPILRGFDDTFYAPVSRYTDVAIEKISNHPNLKLLASSKEAGPLLITSTNRKMLMITGHLEYETKTLGQEFERDLAKGIDVHVPFNYFPNDNPQLMPTNRWRSHAHLLFSNWLNYYVYQQTPFVWD
jgi:homoserine O-succinyltransferase/O-acetyltransferase